MLRIGIVVGEASGDTLGADLVRCLKKEYSNLEVVGIGGEQLIKQGCVSLYDMERLSVMGILEIAKRYFELLKIRRKLKEYFLSNPPDLFIGVDAPEFNLSLEQSLRSHGIKTVHYVSPSVWAWREYRLKKIKKAVDLMLVLFPFELRYYEKNNIAAKFVGHPLASQMNTPTDIASIREKLNIPSDKRIVALMPGSRSSETSKLMPLFLETASMCRKRYDDLYFVSNLVDENTKEKMRALVDDHYPELNISIFTGKSREVMEASDFLLLASGTITLEAMFLKKPMVVAYRFSWLTYQIFRVLIHTPFAALPNLLAGKMLVPECIQNDCCVENLAEKLEIWLNSDEKVNRLKQEFKRIHEQMLQQDNTSAANAVKTLLTN